MASIGQRQVSRCPSGADAGSRRPVRDHGVAMLWPLLVILLPLAGMAGLVWWTLGTDRRAVEAEAKAQGQELAEAVMNRVRETLDVGLAVRFGSASPGWPAATERGTWSKFTPFERLAQCMPALRKRGIRTPATFVFRLRFRLTGIENLHLGA